MKEIILASNSPRRKELLRASKIDFKVVLSNVEEKYSKIECNEKNFDSDKYFRYSGHVFKKCPRKWRFKKYDI